MALGIVEPLAEERVELVAPVRRLERFAVEPTAVYRRAQDDGVELAFSRDEIRAERFVAVPDTEVARCGQRRLPLTTSRKEELRLTVDAQRAGQLHALAPVVVAVVASRSNRGEARLDRRDLPLIIARRQIVELCAEKQLPIRKDRALASERIPE